MRWLAFLPLLLLRSTDGVAGGAVTEPVPVLVELFTSEGCSSCPPADALLARLVDEQPVRCARVIGLGEHVDYWNDLGWRDPFSSPEFTKRQLQYVRRFGSDSPYTPQAVIGGGRQVLGSSWRAVTGAVADACRATQGSIALHVRHSSDGRVVLDVDARWPEGSSADVIMALVQDHAVSTVRHGENAGRTLTHTAIARTLTTVGSGRGAFTGYAEVGRRGPGQGNRLIVFVQEPGGGRIHAAASMALPAL